MSVRKASASGLYEQTEFALKLLLSGRNPLKSAKSDRFFSGELAAFGGWKEQK
jgi:hypothetical protein